MHSDRRSGDQILDVSVLDDLAALDDGLLAEVLDTFLKDVPVRIAAIRTAAISADAVAVARGAHALKGSALAVGATPLVTLCQTLERAAESGQSETLVARVADLEPAFALVRGALAARCGRAR